MADALNETLPGSPRPLGADWDGEGVNFALSTEAAETVELSLFAPDGAERRYRMGRSGSVWHGYVAGIGPGQRYGYRVSGAGETDGGARCKPHPVMLDPYARAVDLCATPEHPKWESESESASAPTAVVIDPTFDWEGDASPRTPWHRTVIYQADVRGLTMRHPEVPEPLRGTYAGLAHPAVVRHLRELGITAIELAPVHTSIDDNAPGDEGPRRDPRYDGFFAPDSRTRCGGDVASEVRQFKEMVKALHRTGIEIILDVAYTFQVRGTGDPLHAGNPQVFALIMDSLRYWSGDMHVDGFRFAPASDLARHLHEADRLSTFFSLVHDSAVLRDVKLIGEPLVITTGDHQLRHFPVHWAERNYRYGDTIRSLWTGNDASTEEIGYRLTGSSDLYDAGGRHPVASINVLSGHGGGDGVAGEDTANVGQLTEKQRRNLLATLLLSQGTPVLRAGEEFAAPGDEFAVRPQGPDGGSRQTDTRGWLDWNWSDDQRAFLGFTKHLLQTRQLHPTLRRPRFFQGRPIHGTVRNDLAWFQRDGQPLSDADWQGAPERGLAMFLAGRGMDDVDEQGRPLIDDNLLLLLNPGSSDCDFRLPTLASVKEAWQVVVDTAQTRAPRTSGEVPAGGVTTLARSSLKLLRSPSRVVRTGGVVHTLGSTYRLQLTKDFGFKDARAVLDYLQELGATDLYTSPVFAAGRGSTHGYDVVDHGRLNPELGTDDDFIALSDELKSRGMGLLMDWVPNHMGILPGQNALWEDVLENGPSSLYADVFDIDWTPARKDGAETVLVPVLGDQYGTVLERGELRIVRDDVGWFHVAYFDNTFPLGPRTLLPVLRAVAARTGLGETDEAQQELQSICSALENLPTRGEREPAARRQRARETEVVKRRFRALVAGATEIDKATDAVVHELNGSPDVPATFDDLDGLLRDQAYRLASWRVASEEINYRRFFDINTLAAIRMENPAVFDKAHALLFRLLDEGRIQALRLDHTDGLYDPLAYFEKLQLHFRRNVGESKLNPDDAVRPLPLLVEKILEPGERLPPSWPVDGTTGYDFTAAVQGLWVDAAAESALTEIHRRFTGDNRTYAEHVYACKQRVLLEALPSEVNMLARQLKELAASDRRWRDFTLIALTGAIRETLAAFPVYRTYIRPGEAPSEQDRRRVSAAIQAARLRTPTLDPSVLSFLQDVLLLRAEATADDLKSGLTYVALRLQQLTGPVMAKAVEDTAFYRYNRLLCLNEVGGDPGRFGTSLEQFHVANAERLQSWPLAMVTTSTHDTKRGEDAAACIAVLSEIPDEWQRVVTRWSRKAARYKGRAGDGAAPSRRDEYTIFQTLVGAWPFGWNGRDGRQDFAARMVAHMGKVAKEAKQETSWIRPNPEYDRALREFVEGLFGDETMIQDIATFGQRLGPHAASNALAQTLLRLCAPGIPDTYQGSELWNQSLVDPDNRRPVDFAARRALLSEMSRTSAAPGAMATALLGRWHDGAVKLFVTQTALTVRGQMREVFLRGDYTPINGGKHVVSFARRLGTSQVVVVTPRLPLTLTRGESPWAVGTAWGTQALALPEGRYRDAFSGTEHPGGEAVPLERLLREFPLALLVSRTA